MVRSQANGDALLMSYQNAKDKYSNVKRALKRVYRFTRLNRVVWYGYWKPSWAIEDYIRKQYYKIKNDSNIHFRPIRGYPPCREPSIPKRSRSLRYKKNSQPLSNEITESPIPLNEISQNINPQKDCMFLQKLPREVRCIVYDELRDPGQCEGLDGGCNFDMYYVPQFHTSILRTCKSVYFEALDRFAFGNPSRYIFRETTGSYWNSWESRATNWFFWTKSPMNNLCKSFR